MKNPLNLLTSDVIAMGQKPRASLVAFAALATPFFGFSSYHWFMHPNGSESVI
jgi:hypothetical protein